MLSFRIFKIDILNNSDSFKTKIKCMFYKVLGHGKAKEPQT